jgi:hypothetical protein
VISNNLNNINDLEFYHEIRGNLALASTDTINPPYAGWILKRGSNTDTNNLIFFFTGTSGGTVGVRTTAAILVTGLWQHLCATYDGSQAVAGLALYLNGQPQALTVLFSGTPSGVNDRVVAVPLTGGGSGCCLFQGFLDDIRLWARARAPAEIQQVYTLSLRGDAELFSAGAPVVRMQPLVGGAGTFLPFFRESRYAE